LKEITTYSRHFIKKIAKKGSLSSGEATNNGYSGLKSSFYELSLLRIALNYFILKIWG